MTAKLYKKCKRCSTEFRAYKSTDQFCSYDCANEVAKAKRAANPERYNKPKKTIAQVSAKQAKLNREYTKIRREFLDRPENKYCPVCWQAYNGKITLEPYFQRLVTINAGRISTNEIHHKAGRVGDLYLDTSHFLAVSSIGHKWIHENPEKARNFGFLEHSTKI